MNEAIRPALPLRHASRFGIAFIALACAALLASSGCSVLGTGSAGSVSPTICSDKVVQSITENAKVDGLWNCLSTNLQDKLKNYVAAGIFHSADDAVFVDPSVGKPPIIGTHLVGLNNGVAVYTVVAQSQSAGAVVLTVTLWLNPAPKVNNLAISSPAL